LGLIKVKDEIDLCCESDPAIGGESDAWTVRNGHAGATVVRVRPLNDREMLRLSSAFVHMGEMEPDAVTPAQTLEFTAAMENVIRAAFVSCTEGDQTTTDVDLVITSLKMGPLIALGSYILNESGGDADPT
tara:strand:- start:13 stop:405 length:393 start_codon:yes stop_codon:yes gene_type:complete